MDNTAFIFPAFITEYTKKELHFLENNKVNINDYILKVSKLLKEELPEFTYDELDYKKNELYSQLIAYCFSCAFSDILHKKGIKFNFAAGYSMGIYASLYAVKSISFETGVKLIYNAYKIVQEITVSRKYGMGAIVGLTVDDVNKLITDLNLTCNVINTNNQHSIVVAGLGNDIRILIENSRIEGAMSASELTVNTPYHSKFLLKYANQFKDYIKTVNIEVAKVPLISTFNQRTIMSKDDLKSELVINLTERINWFKTMQQLLGYGVKQFYEVGAGKDLKKIARFIDGDYKLKSVYKT